MKATQKYRPPQKDLGIQEPAYGVGKDTPKRPPKTIRGTGGQTKGRGTFGLV